MGLHPQVYTKPRRMATTPRRVGTAHYILTNSGAKPAGTVKVSVGGGGKFWPDSGLLNTAEATSPAEHTVTCEEGDTGTYVCSALATTTGGQRLKGKCFKRVTYNRKSRKLPKDVTRSDLEDDEAACN